MIYYYSENQIKMGSIHTLVDLSVSQVSVLMVQNSMFSIKVFVLYNTIPSKSDNFSFTTKCHKTSIFERKKSGVIDQGYSIVFPYFHHQSRD